MTIHIIKPKDLYVTQEQYNKALQEYNAMMYYMVNPISFDEYLRQRYKDNGNSRSN